jgi:hypothetical protein
MAHSTLPGHIRIFTGCFVNSFAAHCKILLGCNSSTPPNGRSVRVTRAIGFLDTQAQHKDWSVSQVDPYVSADAPLPVGDRGEP